MRPTRLTAGLAVAVAVAVALAIDGCGGWGGWGGSSSGASPTTAAETGQARKAVAFASSTVDEVSPYLPLEPAFYQRFLYYSEVAGDSAMDRYRVFGLGVGVCTALGRGQDISSIEDSLVASSGLTRGGVESVAGAATEILCPSYGVRVLTRTESVANTVANAVSNQLGGAPVEVDSVGRNLKLACQYLDVRPTASGLSEYLLARGEPMLSSGARLDLSQVKALVWFGVPQSCMGNEDKIGPFWVPDPQPVAH